MPQQFNVLCCCECGLFQVHQEKKSSNKWNCKVCGVKQSMKRVYGSGSSSECRVHVQKLNMLKAEQDNSRTEFGQQNPRRNVLKEVKEFIAEGFFDLDIPLVPENRQSHQENDTKGLLKICGIAVKSKESESQRNMEPEENHAELIDGIRDNIEKEIIAESRQNDEHIFKKRRMMPPQISSVKQLKKSHTSEAMGNSFNDLVKDIDFDSW